MHFVQLLSSTFFSNPGATRNLDADAAWLLVSYLYQKEKQDFFCHCEWACSSCQAIEEKGLKCELFPPVPHFELPSVHENMSSMPSQSPLTASFIFHNELGCPLMQKPYLLDEFMNLFLIFIFRIILPTFLYLSVAPLKNQAYFCIRFSFRILEKFFKTCRECFWVRNFLLFKSSEIPIG